MRLAALAAAALLCACGNDAQAFLPLGGSGGGPAPPGTMLPLGINLDGPQYYGTELPFINVMKSGGVSSAYNVGWLTATNGNFPDTSEEAYLQVDSDGYPTSLTASPTPPGGQVFNSVFTTMNYNIGSVAPGAPSAYPAGQYRLKFEGQGTIKLLGDPSVVGGDTCSGLALTNSSSNTYVSCTFHVVSPSPFSGIQLAITAITNSVDHPRDISVMLQSNAAAYDGGAIFNPALLAAVAPFSSLRFMTWKNTNNEFGTVASTTSLSSGATSLTLSSPWSQPSGTFPVVFIDGEQRNATLTLGSSTATWSTGLTNAISSRCSGGAWQWGGRCYYTPLFIAQHTWANRSKPSNAFWTNVDGVPLEVVASLCNQIQTNCYVNVPAMYSDADIQAMGQLMMSGTGMQSGYSGLASALTATFELSNETWNCFTFQQCLAISSLGGAAWPTQPPGSQNFTWNRNWYGMRSAQMAADLQTGVGSTIFARVIPTIGAQMSVTSTLTDPLTTSYWSSGPACQLGGTSCAYPIKAINIAPYWGGNVSAADCATMTAVADPLSDFFATMTGQAGPSGNTYSSVPAGGWEGETNTWILQYTALLPSYPTLNLTAYEGGDNFNACFNTGLCQSVPTCSGWPALVTSAERDARMGATYLTEMNFWKTAAGGAKANAFNIFQDVGAISLFGSFGLLESIMQPITPLTSAPAKYNAAVTYIQ